MPISLPTLQRHVIGIALLMAVALPLSAQLTPGEWTVPVSGNTYITLPNPAPNNQNKHGKDSPLAKVGRMGCILKNDTLSRASTYVYISQPSRPQLSLQAMGHGHLLMWINSDTFRIAVNAETTTTIPVGELRIDSAGYLRMDYALAADTTSNGRSETSVVVSDFVFANLESKPIFIARNFSPHFGLRGPSVHLHYPFEGHKESNWIYSEVTVPTEGDAPGGYYCALGFDGGYMGIQNLGNGERCVVFSVWNAAEGDNTSQVAPEYRTQLLSKGEQVRSRNFGHEGSGVQNFLDYAWRPGQTYRFLIHAQHADDGRSTDYTAYFYAPEQLKWNFIATLRRPHTKYLLRGIYSFVENFKADYGNRLHKAYFSNIWAESADDSTWRCATEARVTNDETGNRGIRLDYEGGVINNRFYLKTGAYFGNGSVCPRQLRIESEVGHSPQQYLDALPTQ